MIVHNIDQNSPEWQQVRCGKFTASDAQTIGTNGKGLETLVYKKVAEKLTKKQEQGYYNGNMERGHELEMTARNAYEIETGNSVTEIGFCELDENTGASPDGMVAEDGLVEIKCKTDAVYVKDLYLEEIDPEHFAQMQMQMWVTDRKWCDYVVFNPNFKKEIYIRRVNRDEFTIGKIKAGVEAGISLMNLIISKIQ